jgi:hypothetical protein
MFFKKTISLIKSLNSGFTLGCSTDFINGCKVDERAELKYLRNGKTKIDVCNL